MKTENTALVEYESSLTLLQGYTQMRRQGLAFSVTVQAAILAFVSSGSIDTILSSVAVSIFGLFIAFLGYNNENRIFSYICGYAERARELEAELGMNLITRSYTGAKSVRRSVSNNVLFRLFYLLIGALWIVFVGMQVFARSPL